MEPSMINEKTVKNLEEEKIPALKEDDLTKLKEPVLPNLKDEATNQLNSTKEALPKSKKNILSPVFTWNMVTDAKVEDKRPMQSSLNPADEMNLPRENQAKGGKDDNEIEKDALPAATASRHRHPIPVEMTTWKLRDPQPTQISAVSTTDNSSSLQNQQGNLKPEPESSSSSEVAVVVGDREGDKKKSKEPFCCPKQVLRLLADHDYTFRQEEWKLKGKLQGAHPERIHLVVIVAQKYGQGELTGMGIGRHFSLAENSAALDLCEQLATEHHLHLPKSGIYPDLRFSPDVFNALRRECDERKLSGPQFGFNQPKSRSRSRSRSAYGGLLTCNVFVAKIQKQGRGITDHVAKLDGAYKMYETITGKEFPLVEIVKGKHCSGELHRYNQTSNREFPMTKLKIPSRGLIPSGFRASLEAQASAPLMPKGDVAKVVLVVEAALEVPSKSEGRQLTKTAELSDDVNNKDSEKATKLRLEEQLSSPDASSPDDRVDQDQDQSRSRSQKKDVVVVGSGSTKNDVITSALPAIRETTYYYMDEVYPEMISGASQDMILLGITSLVALVVVFAMIVEYYVAKM